MRLALCCLVLISLLAGCRAKKPPTFADAPEPPRIDYSAELPPGTVGLRKIAPGQYPDFSDAFLQPHRADLIKAIDQSLVYLAKPSSQKSYPYGSGMITHEQAVETLKALKGLLLQKSARTPDQWNAVVAEMFDVYQSIGAPNPQGGFTNEVLFTGYCTPIYPASLTRQGPYQWPLYKRPADLITDPEGKRAARRTPDGQQDGYPTREELERSKMLEGQELVYLTSRWDAYVIHVQGSAFLQMPDGKRMEIGYAGNNGQEYVSPGLAMVKDGVISKDQLSLRGLRTYFQQNPAMMDKYLNLNPRYVFFAERPGGPFGSLNVPVTPMASIATDKDVYPRAMPAFVKTTIPASVAGGTRPFRAFMLDQDTGGAIRAAGRCDLYMGIGPTAEALAGQQLHTGQLYYLAVKPGVGPTTTRPSAP
jgi:membrane-bound lytic murein transglycosylase A